MKNPEKNRRGLFITFEGPEGSGKSSQINMLGEYFKAMGLDFIITREPGGTPLAEKIRNVVKQHCDENESVHPGTELLLIEAARFQHVSEVIVPALKSGKAVLCDRFYDSTTAYQGGARGIDGEMIDSLNAFASGKCQPDLTILLDLPPEVGFERAGRRQETKGEYDRFEQENLDFHRQVRKSFLELAVRHPERIKVVDADRSREEIQMEIRKYVHALI